MEWCRKRQCTGTWGRVITLVCISCKPKAECVIQPFCPRSLVPAIVIHYCYVRGSPVGYLNNGRWRNGVLLIQNTGAAITQALAMLLGCVSVAESMENMVCPFWQAEVHQPGGVLQLLHHLEIECRWGKTIKFKL